MSSGTSVALYGKMRLVLEGMQIDTHATHCHHAFAVYWLVSVSPTRQEQQKTINHLSKLYANNGI